MWKIADIRARARRRLWRNPPTGVRRRTRSAFTLVEALVTLAILAVLLAALGSAVYAAMESFRENQRIATASQTARGLLQRMMREIRTAAAVDANSTTITLIAPPDANGLTMIQYQYDSANKRLNYKRTVYGTTTSYVACGDNGLLTRFTISTQSGKDWQGLTCIKNIRIIMTLQLGPEAFTVTSSASPRRNQVF
jgi:prepilin-type N-terminal cleavage/methylation domain-containing protein